MSTEVTKRCTICNSTLSMYNKGEICFRHDVGSGTSVPEEITIQQMFANPKGNGVSEDKYMNALRIRPYRR